MVALAPYSIGARLVELSPSDLFNAIARRLDYQPAATLLRTFGSRTDVTLDAFGWSLVDQGFRPECERI